MNNKTILYIAPIYDGTGYAHLANNTILTLDAAGYDVYVRKVKLTGQKVEPPRRVLELEEKELPSQIDITIQHMLPPLMTYNKSGGKNIGYFHCETNDFSASGWQHHLNMMDEVWVSCPENMEACVKSGVKRPIKVATAGYWPTQYQHKIDENFRKSLGIGNKTVVFYTIGDFSERKGIKNLIECYLRSFSNIDDVVLVLKTYVDGKHPQESLKITQNAIDDCKKNLRLTSNNNFPRIIVLPEYMDESMIYNLHAASDIFITLEVGAAWNIPAVEAWNHGNYVMHLSGYVAGVFINPPTHIFRAYDNLDKDFPQRYLVQILSDECKDLVGGMGHCTYPGLYTGKERWYASVPIEKTIHAMIQVYHEVVTTNHEKHDHKILRMDVESEKIKELCNH